MFNNTHKRRREDKNYQSSNSIRLFYSSSWDQIDYPIIVHFNQQQNLL